MESVWKRASGRRRVSQFSIAIFGLMLAAIMAVPAVSHADERENDIWFEAPKPPERFTTSAPQTLSDGRILVSLEPPSIYDPYSGTWETDSEYPLESDYPTWGSANVAALAGNRFLKLGGSGSSGITPSSWGTVSRAAIYEVGTDSWTDIPSMNANRGNPSVSHLPDGSVLVAGGITGGGVAGSAGWYVNDSAERYLPDENRWQMTEPMTMSRQMHTATVLDDGSVIVVGGRGAQYVSVHEIERYDPATNTWTVIAELSEPLLGHTATLLPDGRILIAGGITEPGRNPIGAPTARALFLDPETGALTKTTSMQQGLRDHAAILTPDGDVFVIGGVTDEIEADDRRTASTAFFDLELEVWREGPNLNQPRSHSYVTAFSSESQGALFYIYGGVSLSEDEAFGELYYPVRPGVTDRQPPPVEPHPSIWYFPETGHYLAWGFKDFWEKNGGLPVFGFPLTTEFDEYNPDLGEKRISQYFERQRFEYHPELAGTSYEVQLGRLGVADAKARGFLDSHPAFEWRTESGDCIYFEETRFTVCGAFKTYWESHGLDFGDSGVSYRESLALFGYPISTVFTDPDSGLAVQYFERARFEWHQDNPEPYRVLLGRLAADIVENGELSE